MAINAQDLANAVALAMQQIISPLTESVKNGILEANAAGVGGGGAPKSPQGFFKSLFDSFPEFKKSVSDFKKSVVDWAARLGKRTAAGNVGSALSVGARLGVGAVAAPASAGMAAAGAAGGQAQSIVSMFNTVFGPIASLVEKMDPATVQMFELAMNDLMAVMGEILLPVLQAGTGLVRKFADILNSIQPAFDPIIEVIVELVGIMGDLLLPIFEVLTPLIQLFGAILKALMPVVQFLATIFAKVMGFIAQFTKGLIDMWNTLANSWLGRQLGLKGISEVKPSLEKSSMGKAVYNTGYTSADQLGKAARAAALKGGIGKGWDQQTAENTRQTAIELLEHKRFWAGMAGDIAEVLKLGQQIKELKEMDLAPEPGAPPL